MMELDIDQSHLPRVQEVCQGFAVLEDGALAYNLQEQEIEQFYSSNVQKSQLVQNDIRMAKQLQDEEELRANRIARQIEERDSEYARMIQEELQRCAEDARRREEEDEEMAKRLQEEEEMDSRRQRLDSGCHGDVNDIFLREERASVPERSRPRRPVRPRPSPSPSPSPDSSVSEGETRLPSATRGRSHGSHTDSDSADPPSEPSSPVLQNNSAPQHGSRQTDALRLIRNLLQESLGPSYNVEDEVFLRAPSLPAHRLQKRLNTAPSGHQGPDRHTQGGNRHSISSSVREGERVGEGWEERERVVASRRNGNRVERWHSNSYHGDQRWEEEDYHSREARSQDRVYSRTYTEGGQSRRRHVHFQDDRRRYSSYHGDSRSGTSPGSSYQNNFSDRGVAARRSCYGDFRQAPQRGSQGNRNVQTVGSGSSRHHLSDVLLRNVSVRRSSHGDFSDRRRESGRDGRRAYGNQNTQSGHRASYRENPNIQEDRVSHQGDFRNGRSSQDHRDQGEWEGGSHGNRRGREEEGRADRDHHGDRRVRRSVSERLRASEDPESSSEEEGRWRVERRRSEGGQREERPQGERVHRSISFSGRTPPPAAGHRGTGVTPRRDGASLELSELGQVLQDEELARKLQEEEERLLRKSPPAPRDPQASSPRGDFRAAQVAQDEEIARFMQRSEKKAQRRSCDLEGQGSRRDQRDPDNGQERSARETTMELPQGPRQRLDSQGLNSPTEDLSPDCQPPSPNCVASQLQAVRNIAEELDPTFKAKRRDSNPAGQSSSGLSTSPSSPSGLHDYPQEPTFVPPTKRQSDKSSRPKAKEKKESCKQQ